MTSHQEENECGTVFDIARL